MEEDTDLVKFFEIEYFISIKQIKCWGPEY